MTAGGVTSFLVAESRRLAPKTVQRLATALRSLLRFWHLDGVVSVSLVEAVPKVANGGRRPAAGAAAGAGRRPAGLLRPEHRVGVCAISRC